MCPILKKLSNEQQSFHEARRIIYEILVSNRGNDTRVLDRLFSYASFQFGKEVTGKSYRERGDGERISNWMVDIDILYAINGRIIQFYYGHKDTISNDNLVFTYYERSLSILSPWLIHLDSDASDRIDNLKEDEILYYLFETERNMASISMKRWQFDVTEGHCQRSLAYSRRFGREGIDKTTLIFIALKAYFSLREHQGNYSEAVNFAEEAYNLVVSAYDPVHPQVQEAAGFLIHILTLKGDLYDGERYAQITYSNLRDKKNGMDQNGAEVAQGAYNLADVILQPTRQSKQTQLLLAKAHFEESVRINLKIYGPTHPDTVAATSRLADILRDLL
jgi:hypothetical protein